MRAVNIEQLFPLSSPQGNPFSCAFEFLISFTQVEFRLEMPNAQKVAVTVGSKWTQLAKDAGDASGLTWSGTVNAAATTDKVQVNAAIDANPQPSGGFFGFGGGSSTPSFKQILEYSLV